MAILQSISKLKASVSLLVGENQELTEKIRQLYINNQTIFLNQLDYENYKESKNTFMQFLERDERKILKDDKRLSDDTNSLEYKMFGRNKTLKRSLTA